ncbi:MAG: hypothetical protein IRY94_00185 [Rhodospirillaceae bacterium]|nr:hypothetical protein [Rhodospirillaceae bacterium]
MEALVRQAGKIFVDGGTVVLTAAAEGVIDRIIDAEGIVQARSIQDHQGQIAFVGDGGEVRVAGDVDASGRNDGQVGGTVHVPGSRVTLASTASIDVSGDRGGGTVLVDGDLHGGALQRGSGLGYQEASGDGGTTIVVSNDIETSGYIPESEITYVEAGAVVTADAIDDGGGGRTVFWSNGATTFEGASHARGGAAGGDGGFVEISGLASLGHRRTVDTSASRGRTGTLLLDPGHLDIDATTATNIVTALNSNNVVMTTDSGGDGDILVEAPISWRAGTRGAERVPEHRGRCRHHQYRRRGGDPARGQYRHRHGHGELRRRRVGEHGRRDDDLLQPRRCRQRQVQQPR